MRPNQSVAIAVSLEDFLVEPEILVAKIVPTFIGGYFENIPNPPEKDVCTFPDGHLVGLGFGLGGGLWMYAVRVRVLTRRKLSLDSVALGKGVDFALMNLSMNIPTKLKSWFSNS